MYSLLITAVAAFAVSFLLTPLCRNLAVRWGLLDRPDQARKIHARPIPRIGGIPILIAYLASFGLLLLLPLRGAGILREHLDLAGKLLPAVAIVFATGLLDDLYGLKPWQKLAGQLVAAVAAVLSGIELTGFVGLQYDAWFALPVTVIWLVGCANAFNLIDGVDGLAAGVGLFATITTLLAALLKGDVPLALATVPLAGALVGFLRYNFNPASIFLGDCGSLLIGFLLGCYGILWSQKSATLLGMTAPLMALAIPLMDTGLSIIRRFLRGQPIFGADRRHIHHLLLARGFTPRGVALMAYGICGICATLSLLLSVVHERSGGVIIVLFCAGAWIGVQHLGYTEFGTARRIVFSGTFRRLVNAQVELGAFREELTAASTFEECWKALRHGYSEFGFYEIRAKIGDQVYTHSTGDHEGGNAWIIRISLSGSEYVNLTSEFDGHALAMVGPLADSIGRVMRAKIAEIHEADYRGEDEACTRDPAVTT